MKFNLNTLNESGCASSPDISSHVDDLKFCNNCTLCREHLNKSTIFHSTVTNESFSIPDHRFGIEIACTTKNVVYLITCDLCKFQYVGMTTTSLRTRFAGHRSAIKNKKHNTCLYDHFTDYRHSIEHAKVQIIYHYDKIDNAKDVLLTVEEFYMRKLGTLWPFGLNDNVTSLNINLSNCNLSNLNKANTPFFTFGSERRKRSHGHRKSSKVIPTLNVAIEILNTLFVSYTNAKLHDVYILLRSFSRSLLKYLIETLDEVFKDHPAKNSILRKILMSYNTKFTEAPKLKNDNYVYCTIPFLHKALETVGLRELFKSKELKNYLPVEAHKFKIRTVYSYGPTIGKKIFNYNKVLSDITPEDLSSSFCDCNTRYSAYVYTEHGHVHTGKLDIIENNDLRIVMSKGAKFRLVPSITKSKIWASVKEAIMKFIKKLSKKCKLNEDCFHMWYEKILNLFKKRLHSQNYLSFSNNIFDKQCVADYLNTFQQRFVIVPVDKACNNFAIVCRLFYIKVLMSELGVSNTGSILGNDVYQHVSISFKDFFSQQILVNKSLGNILLDTNQNIPKLYWTSKQHKNPYKFRFIAGASHCTNKTISIEVALALKCIKCQFKNYCRVIYKHRGLNYFWSIDNSAEFLEKLSNVKYADSIETFDFSTLYTSLPLDNIFESLERLIIKMYRNSGSNIILVNSKKGKAFWPSNKIYKGYKQYSIGKLLDALKFILYNTYVQFAGYIFRQIRGIPMGGNASPFIADLYLAWHEFCFMENIIRSKSIANYKLARLLSLNSRYIDDIAVVNLLGFEKIAKDIYHHSLVLECSSTGYHYDTFLDLNIRIFQGDFVIGIYHKVDDFNFEVINYPFLDSNIHSQIGYNAFYSQLVRFFRLCTNTKDFFVRVCLIRNKLSARGYKIGTLFKYFLKFCDRYQAHQKYGVANGRSLWNLSCSLSHVVCSSDDVDTMLNITKPCHVVLEDIYTKAKSAIVVPLKKCHVPLEYLNLDLDVKSYTIRSLHSLDISSESFDISCNSVDNSTNAISSNSSNISTNASTRLVDDIYTYTPVGLPNPSNHCYINSSLHVFLNILSSLSGDIHINENQEGQFIEIIKNKLTRISKDDIVHIKDELSNYNSFFDGSIQRDAFECFDLLLLILHQGTKENLVDMSDSMIEDCFVTSITKSLFWFTVSKTVTCSSCGHLNSSFENLYFFSLLPSSYLTNQNTLQLGLNDQFMKKCCLCHEDTKHLAVSHVEDPPRIIFMVVNRFKTGCDRKDLTKIPVSVNFSLNSFNYTLIAAIFHHGVSSYSGHYTCKIVNSNGTFVCNDLLIDRVDNTKEFSESVYMLFYQRNDLH